MPETPAMSPPSRSFSRSNSIPNEKAPKSREPVGIREQFFRKALPLYSGPYSVGLMDIEVPARDPRTFSEIKREHRHLLKLETVLFTVFYPSSLGSGHGESPEGEKKWGRATWVPRPRVEVAKGYGKFAGLPDWITLPLVAATTAFTKIPAWRNAHIAEHWPAEQNSREAGYKIKNKLGKPPPGEPEKPCFPLLIFSHGLGGTRSCYSSVCGEFASYGFVVVAIEHRDGSGPRTFVNQPHMDGDNESVGEDREQSFSKMDYVFPKDNAFDTSPHNEQGVDAELRTAQIQLRLAEIEESYHIMTLINSGRGSEVAASNLRYKSVSPTNRGGSSRGLRGVDWASWTSRFHLKQVTMIGHSFGAATAVEVLRYHKRFNYIGQGIIYDIWGGAIQSADPDHIIQAPLLGISSEAFMYWPDNFEAVMKVCREAKDQGALVWLMTVRGTIHLSQSDFPILYPRIASFILKMTANARRALDLNINASLEFLKLVMPERISAMNRGTDEGLLNAEKLERIPSLRRPEDAWIGFALKIPHEWWVRLTPKTVRRRVAKNNRDGKEPPRDPNGRVLEGLLDLEGGSEIWMHVAPTKDELKAHGLGETGLEANTAEDDDDEDEDGMVESGQYERRQTDDDPNIEQHSLGME